MVSLVPVVEYGQPIFYQTSARRVHIFFPSTETTLRAFDISTYCIRNVIILQDEAYIACGLGMHPLSQTPISHGCWLTQGN